jgi:hypothetical protein
MDRESIISAPSLFASSLAVGALLIGCNFARNAPGRNFQPACAPGQVRVCNGQCVPSISENGFCRLDECSSATSPVARPIGYCRGNLRCDPAAVPQNDPAFEGFGLCRPVPPQTVTCDPQAVRGSDANPCPGVSFCQTVGRRLANGGLPAGVCAVQPNLVGPNTNAICTNPLPEGAPNCDGSWSEVVFPASSGHRTICNPCGPGLVCDSGQCRRSCTAQLQLPSPGLAACVLDPADSSYQYACMPSQALLPTNRCLRLSPHRAACPPASSFETLATTSVVTAGPFTSIVNPREFVGLVEQRVLNADGTSPCADPRDICEVTGFTDQRTSACCRDRGMICNVASDCCQLPPRSPYVSMDDRNWSPPDSRRTVLCGNYFSQGQFGNRCIEFRPPGPVGCPPFSREHLQFEAINPGAGVTCLPCGREPGADCCSPPGVLSCIPGLVCDGAVVLGRPHGTCRVCGSPGAPCCQGGVCNLGAACTPNNVCLTCGQAGQPCCPGGVCGANTTCTALNVCVPCGGAGQRCCGNATCDAGSTCDQATTPPLCIADCDSCRRCIGDPQGFAAPCAGPGNGQCRALAVPFCGGRDQPCCRPGDGTVNGSDGCNSNPRAATEASICQRVIGSCPAAGSTWACRACGQNGEQCCPGFSCETGYICANQGDAFACIPNTPCGGYGEPCCMNDQPCGARLACISLGAGAPRSCQPCGGPAQACCGSVGADNACFADPNFNLVCAISPLPNDNPSCQLCGGANQPCCLNAGVATCVAGFTCQATDIAGRSTCRIP